MKRTILILLFSLFSISSFGQIVYNGVVVSEPDSTAVQKRITAWRDSLDNRNFSEDAVKIREEAERLGNKAKEAVKEHTPAIKELMQSVADYFKR